ncbi:GPI alpha-1,4-mannosyltransferase I, catalytic subunit isoform X2 [Siphateles boraxobius]|uniref:GPI alpha-1,4-mannosyltransferase I, catalytic subunit isoform X2 n=1 Tax=Siphateles boraxobius TaxID=180520 RepID=UPI0040648490
MDVRVCGMFSAAVLIRLVLLCVGVYQDQNLQLKYTDVDYHVFTDASRFITQGESPYRRSTFRYTPVLALMLTPNVLLTAHFGKLLFCACDLLSGWLLLRLLALRGTSHGSALVCCGLWLLNPLPAGVSTRGNAESVLAVLVLSTLLCLETRRHARAALLFGLSVHMKIFPLTYALPIALSLAEAPSRERALVPNLLRIFNRDLLLFAAVSGSVFLALNGTFYYIYGWDFLHESYLYHVTRRDIRHNFSPYFYMLYLTAEAAGSGNWSWSGIGSGIWTGIGSWSWSWSGIWTGIVSGIGSWSGIWTGIVSGSWTGIGSWSGSLALVLFVPQLLLLLLSSLAFRSDRPFCCFLHTAVFVSFNKYFLWYLCLLPLVLPRVALGWRRGLALLVLWVGGQALWLSPAYFLEFEGRNSFTLIWMAGLLFLLINSFILGQIICHYRPVEAQRKKTD